MDPSATDKQVKLLVRLWHELGTDPRGVDFYGWSRQYASEQIDICLRELRERRRLAA